MRNESRISDGSKKYKSRDGSHMDEWGQSSVTSDTRIKERAIRWFVWEQFGGKRIKLNPSSPLTVPSSGGLKSLILKMKPNN